MIITQAQDRLLSISLLGLCVTGFVLPQFVSTEFLTLVLLVLGLLLPLRLLVLPRLNNDLRRSIRRIWLFEWVATGLLRLEISMAQPLLDNQTLRDSELISLFFTTITMGVVFMVALGVVIYNIIGLKYKIGHLRIWLPILRVIVLAGFIVVVGWVLYRPEYSFSRSTFLDWSYITCCGLLVVICWQIDTYHRQLQHLQLSLFDREELLYRQNKV